MTYISGKKKASIVSRLHVWLWQSSHMPIRKDFTQQCRVGSGTGKGPVAQMGKVEEKRWVDAKNTKERKHIGRRPQCKKGRLEGRQCQVRLPYGQMVRLWGEGRSGGREGTSSLIVIT